MIVYQNITTNMSLAKSIPTNQINDLKSNHYVTQLIESTFHVQLSSNAKGLLQSASKIDLPSSLSINTQNIGKLVPVHGHRYRYAIIMVQKDGKFLNPDQHLKEMNKWINYLNGSYYCRCDECFNRADQRYGAGIHVIQNHIRTKLNIYLRCGFCSYSNHYMIRLKKHMAKKHFALTVYDSADSYLPFSSKPAGVPDIPGVEAPILDDELCENTDLKIRQLYADMKLHLPKSLSQVSQNLMKLSKMTRNGSERYYCILYKDDSGYICPKKVGKIFDSQIFRVRRRFFRCICNDCMNRRDFRIDTKYQLYAHLQRSLGIKIQCSFCLGEFSSISGIRCHIRKKHWHQCFKLQPHDADDDNHQSFPEESTASSESDHSNDAFTHQTD